MATATGLKRAVTKMKATSSHMKKRGDKDDDNNSFSMSKPSLVEPKITPQPASEKVEIKIDPVFSDKPQDAADLLAMQDKRLKRTNSNSRPPHELIETERLLGAGELKIKSQITRKNSNSSPRASLNPEQLPAQDLAKLKGLNVGGGNDLQPRKTVKEMAKDVAEPALEPRKTVKEMTNMWKQSR